MRLLIDRRLSLFIVGFDSGDRSPAMGDIDTGRKTIGIRNSEGGFSRYARMTEEIKGLFVGTDQGAREDLIFSTSRERSKQIPTRLLEG